jgi:intracellular sulfur oxidation DsrE/DsrF family protein
VSVEICNSTMKSKGWTGNDLLPGVTIVHDAYTRLIDLQHRNYAYIRF